MFEENEWLSFNQADDWKPIEVSRFQDEIRLVTPDEHSGLLIWVEGDNQPETVGNPVATLLGMGGTANSQTQADASKKPTMVQVGVHKAIGLDNVDDYILFAVGTSITALPLTAFVVYRPKTTAGGTHRVLAGDGTGGGGSHNWLIGTSGAYYSYTGTFIGGTALDTKVKIHTLRQTSGGVSKYRIDGVQVGSDTSYNLPGVISVGPNPTSYTEPANADVLAIVVYNTELNDTQVAQVEQYLFKFLAEDGVHATQLVEEVTAGADPYLHVTQLVEEPVVGGDSFLHITQAVIEIVFKLFVYEDYVWAAPILNEQLFARPIVGDQDQLVRRSCPCVAVPGMSVCVHGNPMTYFDCLSSAPPIYANPLTGIEIPCEM